jgi:hypothetical protein
MSHFEIDVGHDIPQFSPVCSYCRHATGGFRSCAAFGDGEIPLPIWTGENGHTTPYPGDNGIRFEPAEHAPEGVPRREAG